MAILIGPLDIVRHLSNNLTFLLQERMLARQRRPILCYGLGKPSVIAQLAFRPVCEWRSAAQGFSGRYSACRLCHVFLHQIHQLAKRSKRGPKINNVSPASSPRPSAQLADTFRFIAPTVEEAVHGTCQAHLFKSLLECSSTSMNPNGDIVQRGAQACRDPIARFAKYVGAPDDLRIVRL